MDSIEEYITKLKIELRNLKADQSLADEYILHIQAEFTDFKTRKNVNVTLNQLEKIFVTQLEDPRIIAQSLAGIDTINTVNTASSKKSPPKRIVLPNTIKLVWNKTQGLVANLRVFYKGHESPLFTAGTIIGISLGITLVTISLLLDVLPRLIRLVIPYSGSIVAYLVDPNKVPHINNYFDALFTVNGIVTFSTLFIMISMLILGWKYDLIYSLKTILYIVFLLTPIFVFCRLGLILYSMLYRTQSYPGFGNFVLDWINAQLPKVSDVTTISINEIIFGIFLYYLIILGFLMSISYLIKLFKTNIYSPKRVKIKLVQLIPVILIFLTLFYFMFFPILDSDDINFQPAYIPPPSPFQSPLIYEFMLGSSAQIFYEPINLNLFIAGIGSLNVYASSSTGSFYFINITAFTFTTSNILAQGCYQQDLFQNTPCPNADTQIHDFLGILYAPVDNFSLYNNLLNTSYPFAGYEPSINTSQQSLVWFANYDRQYMVNLPVFTISYHSNTNNSVFTFQFDRNTGWLMKAVLNLGNGSWAQPLKYNILTIQRAFMFQTVDSQPNANEYNNIINILIFAVTLINWGMIVAVIVYNKKFSYTS